MEIKIKRVVDYISKWEKNDKSDNPITFKLKYLTAAESDDCYSISPLQLDVRGKKVAGGAITVDRGKMFLYAVVEILNLTTIDENGKKTKIKTGEDLLKSPGLEDLYFEVIAFVKGMDARLDVKN